MSSARGRILPWVSNPSAGKELHPADPHHRQEQQRDDDDAEPAQPLQDAAPEQQVPAGRPSRPTMTVVPVVVTPDTASK